MVIVRLFHAPTAKRHGHGCSDCEGSGECISAAEAEGVKLQLSGFIWVSGSTFSSKLTGSNVERQLCRSWRASPTYAHIN